MSTPPTTPMNDTDTSMPPKCSRVTYMALAFFLGAFGVHNFVAGHQKKGFIQLGLGGGGLLLSVVLIGVPMLLAAGVWALIDLFTVTEDGNGVPFDTITPEQYAESEPATPASPVRSATPEPPAAKAA